LDKLIKFDKERIQESQLIKLRRNYLSDARFKPENVEKASQACKLLCSWCISINQYSIIFKNVEPKKKKADALKEKLNEAQSRLDEK